MENTYPTPLEILADPVAQIIIGMFVVLAIWEMVAPAKKLPEIRGWKLRGLISFAAFFFLSSYLPMFTDGYLAEYQLFDLTSLGTVGGTIAGVFVFQLGTWLWHRSMHASDFLWHTFHQMHHSAERLDMYGANYFSLADMVGWTLLGSVCLVLGAGITAATLIRPFWRTGPGKPFRGRDLWRGFPLLVILGSAVVGRAAAHRAFRCRPVRCELDGPDAQHVVTESGCHAGTLQTRVDIGVAARHERQAKEHLADFPV